MRVRRLIQYWAADQDPLFKELFYTVVFSDLKARGKTVVVIAHDDHYHHVGDRCIRLEDGRIVEDGHVRPRMEEERTVCGRV